MDARDVIRIRGARQHNLKAVDVDIPLGALTVITGVSGSGKSSLALDTLYAEGQRRYVETFSAYARQFLDRCDRPDVDLVEGIPAAVAIERKRPVRGSRSTVGTLSELLDHLKLLWAKVGTLVCPGCDRSVHEEGPATAADAVGRLERGTKAILGFELEIGAGRTAAEAAQDLRTAGLTRVLQADGRVEDVDTTGANLPRTGPACVVIDRVVVGRTSRRRLVDSFETAFRAGAGRAVVEVLDGESGRLRFSEGLHCAWCDRDFRAPTPNLFSFNSPLGACATCHGFGRTSGIDWDLVVPDPARSIRGGAVKPFQTPSKRRHQQRLVRHCEEAGIPLDMPWRELDEADRRRVLLGDGAWKGVDAFFRRLQRKIYKVHVRVLLARYRGYPTCTDCGGERLAEEGRAWRVGARTLPDVLGLDVESALAFFEGWRRPTGAEEVVDLLLGEIRSRLSCLVDVGLGYLTLDRQARTLSGGEVQRVNLTAAIGTNLVGALFVLDEPSVGLHPRDNDRLVGMLRRLCDQGNTVVVVEHDPVILAAADHVIDLGPGAGERGGEVVAQGTPAQLRRSRTSLTGAYLAGRRRVEVPPPVARGRRPAIGVRGARAHNLRGVDLLCRLGELTVLSGVSGSGKSSLARDVLHRAVARALGRPEGTPGPHDGLVGVEHVQDVVLVDQNAVGRNRRANAATYLGAWDGIRSLFGRSEAARARGLGASAFSFNVPGGRCERCRGEGVERVEMQFLSDIEVTCPDCQGTRFRSEVREVLLEGLSIDAVLRLTAVEALAHFEGHRRVVRSLAPLVEVGLGYLRLGQSLTTLSSGEAQRLRLASALVAGPGAGAGLYIFDEPTTGLHLEDVAVLLRALRRLADAGHAVLVVEHHVDVMRAADHLVDLGPEGGPDGGRVVAAGTPEEVAQGDGHTARYLRAALAGPAPARRPSRARRTLRAAAMQVRGAREHNLRELDVDLPRSAFVVVTGPSGSGKSTLAFDIVFAEGQRRYIETLSAYARQFVGQLARPDVDHVAGIPPTVAIEQRRTRGGRRSTVATITEVAHFLRLLFARAGVPHCPTCDRELRALPPATLHDRILEEYRGEVLGLFAPVVLGRKGFHRDLLERLAGKGHERVRVDGDVVPLAPTPRLARYAEHDVEVEVASLRVGRGKRGALEAAIRDTLEVGGGNLVLVRADGSARGLSIHRTCPRDGTTVPEPDPRFFSHNSRRGWCPTCRGLGARPSVEAALLPVDEDLSLKAGAVRALRVDDGLHAAFVREAVRALGVKPGTAWRRLTARHQHVLLHGSRSPAFEGAAARFERWLESAPDVAVDGFGRYAGRKACPDCGGARLRPEARAFQVGGRTLPELLGLSVERFVPALETLPLEGRDAVVAAPILREIRERAGFLERLGLGYLSLDRDATTLSGGEAQRIRLAAQLGSNLRGVCYVLDEPTIGLHVRDNGRLLDALESLRDRGNSLLVVEHDTETIRRADLVVDLGPGGGRSGGRVVARGTPEALARDGASPTGRVLARPPVAPAAPSAPGGHGTLEVEGATRHNLQGIDVAVPLGRLVAVTGVSGSGKSTLVREVIYEGVRRRLSGDRRRFDRCRALRGVGRLGRALEVDATPVGRTPRSVPATYLKIWGEIRNALARTREARTRGYGPSRFSFNRKEGRCPECRGRGRILVEMSFLPDVEVPCERCGGRRYDDETLDVTWRGLHAADILALTFAEAAEIFGDFPRVEPFVRLMNDVGLDYLTLGQPSTTLSGGEAQRLKLVTELGRSSANGATLYVLDEPTVGLHGEDVDRLLVVLRRFVERGDTVLVIEHDLDFVARCDHVIDLGPEGGDRGGTVVAQGSPRQVARAHRRSHTGRALAERLAPTRKSRKTVRT